MMILWSISSFDWYLINFQLKYIRGDLYLNTIVSSVCEIPAYALSGLLYQFTGPKLTFVILFGISLIGSLLYIFLDI
jgi:hypothetical protein